MATDAALQRFIRCPPMPRIQRATVYNRPPTWKSSDGPHRRSCYHRLKMRLAAVACLAASLIALAACRSTGDDQPVYSGTIEAVEVDVVAEVSGRVLARPVDQGDRVGKGDPIAVIDS